MPPPYISCSKVPNQTFMKPEVKGCVKRGTGVSGGYSFLFLFIAW